MVLAVHAAPRLKQKLWRETNERAVKERSHVEGCHLWGVDFLFVFFLNFVTSGSAFTWYFEHLQLQISW